MSLPVLPEDHLRPFLREMIHAINNPVGVILGTVQFALSGIEQKTAEELSEAEFCELVDSLRVIERQTKRCAQLVQNMRSLILMGQIELQAADIHQCLSAAKARFNWSGAGIEIREELADSLPGIVGDPEKLTEAFAAIEQNALDAMPCGGVLRLATRRVNATVEVVFDDTGVGISAEELPKIFSPCYSNKPGEGRGLGLATVRLVFEAHGAEMDVRSAPGRGATITVRFPIPTGAQPVGPDASVSDATRS